MVTRERRLALLGARLLRVLLVLSVLAWFLVVFMAACAAYETVTETRLEWVTVNTYLTLSLPIEMTIAKSAYDISVNSAGRELQLTASSAGIAVPWSSVPETARLLITFIVPAIFAFYVYFVFCLQKLFASFAAGRPFQSASVRALRLVAWVLIAGFALEQSARLLSHWLLRRVEVSGEVSVTPPDLLGTYAEVDLAIGVMLLLIAWAFGRAAVTEQERDTLQQEQSLTI